MKIDSAQIRDNKRTIEKLVGKQKNEIALREQELQNIQQIYKKKVDDQNLIGESQLLDIHDRNQQELVEATKEKEIRLEEIKENVQKTQDRLAKEQVNLKKEHNRQIQNHKDRHHDKTRAMFDRAQEQITDINLVTNSKVRDVHANTALTMSKLRHDSQIALDKAAYENDLKVTQAQNGQADALKREQAAFRRRQIQQEMEHKDALANQLLKNQTDFQIRDQIYKDKSTATKKHYEEKIKSEKLAFEEKYKILVEDHKKVIQRLKDAFQARLQAATTKFSKDLKAKDARNQDEFYSLKKLSPVVREDLENYYVDIKTPPHEKENYNLTAHDRIVKLQFNRRSEERMDGAKGDVEKSKRSETLSKEFRVKEIVDDRNLKVSYENGILSYRLPKA